MASFRDQSLIPQIFEEHFKGYACLNIGQSFAWLNNIIFILKGQLTSETKI
jgi:hypothetical protein